MRDEVFYGNHAAIDKIDRPLTFGQMQICLLYTSATDGAIEACTIDKETMEPTYQVVGGGKPIGICGSGLIDIIAELFRCGVVDSRGKIVRTGKRVLRDEHGMGSFIVAFESESDNDRPVLLNEVDIENFIRAKAAIFSAINVLLESTGFDISVVERVIIAGGIGHGINIENAVRIACCRISRGKSILISEIPPFRGPMPW